jgi:hypothetical protein
MHGDPGGSKEKITPIHNENLTITSTNPEITRNRRQKKHAEQDLIEFQRLQ